MSFIKCAFRTIWLLQMTSISIDAEWKSFDEMYGDSARANFHPSIASLIEVHESALEYARIEALILHNIYRCIHGTPPLDLDPRLNAIGQDKAEMLAIEGRYDHAGGFNVGGESLQMGGSEWDLTDYYNEYEMTRQLFGLEHVAEVALHAVRNWYKEVSNVDWTWNETVFGENLWNAGAGHFAGVVYKSNRYLGIGISFAYRFNFDTGTFGVTSMVAGKYLQVDSTGGFYGNIPGPKKTQEECEREIFEKTS